MADLRINHGGFHRGVQARILNAPTSWIFDLNNMLYGTLFHDVRRLHLGTRGHVRADFVSYLPQTARPGRTRSRQPYFLFFIPGIRGLIYAGYGCAADSLAHRGHSNVTAEGPPIYYFKTVIPIAGHSSCFRALLKLSAVSFAFALAPGRRAWTMWKKLTLSRPNSPTASTWTKSRALLRWRRRMPSTTPRHRSVMEEGVVHESNQRRRAEQAMSDPLLGLTMLGLIVVAIMMGFPRHLHSWASA